jgi:peptide/nickel transport system permease protein
LADVVVGGYILRRVGVSLLTFLAATTITFLIMHAAAGSYVPGLDLNPNLTGAQVQQLKSYLGLDRPLSVQYAAWLAGVATGDFGRSMTDGTAVLTLIGQRLPATLLLTVTAAVTSLALAVPLGVAAAVRRGSALDHILTSWSVAGYAVPAFWLGLLLILAFAIVPRQMGLPALPSGGMAAVGINGGSVSDRLQHLILPAAAVAFGYVAIWSRFVRSSMLETLSAEYVRTARAKGMTEHRVLYVHALRNALIPVVTLIGLEAPALFSGSLVVEVLFSWAGMGQLLFQRAVETDYTTVLGLTTFMALLAVAGNLLADLMYVWVDPRVRYGHG